MTILIDLSSNNGHPIDYAQVASAGVIAAFVKATDGTGYTNPYFNADSQGLQAAGVPVLAYHFAEFGDAQAEAAHFISVAGPLARVLDSETNTDVEWQNEFLSALNLPGNEELDYGSASTLPRGGIRSLLWPADYGKNPGFGDAWQFTDAQVVPGVPGLTDASVWTGSQADFNSLFGITPPPPPPPEDPLAVSQAVQYRPGQVDIFQVHGGWLWHKFQVNGGAWQNEGVVGPGGGSSGVTATLADAPPGVAVLNGNSVWVSVELDTGYVMAFAQGPTGGWGAAALP